MIFLVIAFLAADLFAHLWSQRRLDAQQVQLRRLEEQLVATQAAQTPAKQARRAR